MDKNKLAYLYVGLAVLVWGTSPAVAKLLLADLNNFHLPVFTFFFAGVTLFFITLFQGKIEVIKKYTIKDYSIMAYMGFLVALYHVLYYGGLKYSTAQEGFIVNYLWPILTIIFAGIILKERLTLKVFIGIILSFLGAFVVITQGNLVSFSFNHLFGDALAFFGAGSYALFSVLGKKHHYYGKITSMFMYFVFAFLFSSIIAVIFFGIPDISFKELLGLAWLGIMCQALGFVFWFKSMQYTNHTANVANILYLTPFMALFYINFLIGERILMGSIIGLTIIILGILIQNLKTKS